MFSGLSAFPLTPMNEDRIDEKGFISLVERLAEAGVSSIGALGSTGSYPYLDRAERGRVATLAVEYAKNVPVIVGIGALRTRDVLALANDAQDVGASGVLLAPVSYNKLNPDEVFELFRTVSGEISVPLCVYDNPFTTGFTFSDELHVKIAGLPNVASIKIPGMLTAEHELKARLGDFRALIPAHVTIGISGDAVAATGLMTGCEIWYSALGGLFPQTALAILNAAKKGDEEEATRLTNRLAPIWTLFRKYGGGVRVLATAAELIGLVKEFCLPLPLRPMTSSDRNELARIIDELELA
jgi:4-hydroxy-tetrahydrodipicolinate synthase